MSQFHSTPVEGYPQSVDISRHFDDSSRRPHYFVDPKRGEVNELRQLLRTALNERSTEKTREAMKKVIAHMTLGLDVSPIFSDVIMTSSTNDVVLKKLVYLYLMNYSEANVDLSLLAINSFLKDCNDNDSTIRGLAVRSLSYFRVPKIIEFVEPVIRRGLTDSSGHVRKTAVLGLLKLFATNPQIIQFNQEPLFSENTSSEQKEDFMAVLNRMLIKDRDPLVVCGVVHALTEIMASQGGIQITTQLMTHLMNLLPQLNTWTKYTVLSLLSNYTPSNDEELFDLFDILESQLCQNSVTVSHTILNCFIRLTLQRRELFIQLLESRIKNALLTSYMCQQQDSVGFLVLRSIQLIIETVPESIPIFAPDFKCFFCKFDEPVFVKLIKIQLLEHLSTSSNYIRVVDELSEYVWDANHQISCSSVKSLSHIPRSVNQAYKPVLNRLISFLSGGVNETTSAILVAIQELLREKPENINSMLNPVLLLLPQFPLTDSNLEGPAVLLWILGIVGVDDPVRCNVYLNWTEKYINLLRNSSHISSQNDPLSNIPMPPFSVLAANGNKVTTYETLKTNNQEIEVKLQFQLLHTTMKLFFQKPKEIKPYLGQILELFGNDLIRNVSPDLRDEALLYYRLLKEDVNLTREIVEASKDIPSYPVDASAKEKKHKILCSEFNTFSVLYGDLSTEFVKVSQIPIEGCPCIPLVSQDESDLNSPIF